MKNSILLILLSLLMYSCEFKQKNEFLTTLHDGEMIYIRLVQKDSMSSIQTQHAHTRQVLDEWKLPYPVYQFYVADADHDGQDDIWVGVIKTTRFDKKLAKRLFLFKILEGKIRPLWLGSRMGQPLEDFIPFFEIHKQDTLCLIRSLEREQNGKFLIADYKWRKFGLDFVRYVHRELDSLEAYQQLHEIRQQNDL